MRIRSQFRGKALLAVLFALVLAGFAAGAIAADPPVQVTVAVTGTTTPGGTATAKATVKINDGSTLQSISWKQTGGTPATLSGTTTDTVSVALPSLATFKKDLMEVLEEAPIPASSYPSYVPVPAKFEGGLQDRFVVVGITPHGLSDAGGVKLEVTVVTSSGVYKGTSTVTATLPYAPTVGQRNVPIGVPVLLHGKTQASYNWTLTPPAGSKAALTDGATQNPEFLPDVAGTYQVTVTDLATNKPVNLTIHAGTWKGVITGIEANGQPKVDVACTSCHVKGTPHFDMFTPWQRSGHAHILTQNIDDPAGHWSTNCIECHSVGHNESAAAKNNGVDDQADYAAFTTADFIKVGHGAIGNWSKIVTQFPASARLMNIQCENCHGPNDSAAHMKKDGSRTSLSSDMCGSCHGEPPRHGRFQQWQLSAHANYETAAAEGTNASCAKCHSAQGFVQWADNGFSTKAINVTWTTEDVHPQTCQTCHDPHDVGTTSGNANNANLRLMGDTMMLDAGFQAKGVGKAALCMACHNGRRAPLKNDSTFTGTDLSRAPHVGPQADMLMGQNLYFVKTGTVGFHGQVEDSCITCHMTSTPQPAALSLGGGSNHTFYASPAICSKCHTEIKAEDVQGPVEAKMAALKSSIENALKNTMQAQIRMGNFIDFGSGNTIKSAADIASVEIDESHGRQGMKVKLTDGRVFDGGLEGDVRIALALNSIKVVRPTGTSVELLAAADPAVAKAGWNYYSIHSDRSEGVHNPAFINSALDVTLFALNAVNTAFTTPTAPGGVAAPAVGGGIGNGAGAVSCTTPYVYWAEIAGHMPGGNDSQWRTDLVARNLGTSTANLKFILHQSTGNLEGTATINGFSQKAFEDIVATALGSQNGMGSLEICSNQPLLVNGRIFNQAPAGTFGQNLEGRVADLGYSAGQTISLIGLRQKTNAFRTNISVTNGGKTDAQVTVSLFDATGKSVKTYDITVPAGQVVQDNAPFVNRAGQPDIDWGFATVTVVKGTNIITSASLIDMKTNDPTTILGKQ